MQRAYKDISKELVPNILFPSNKEYRDALEQYLEAHAKHYIESIGVNNWISMFDVRLLPEVSENVESLIIIKKVLIFFLFYFFSLKTNAEASETILPRVFVTQCFQFLVNND